MEKLIIEIERQSVGFIASAPELNLQSYGESLQQSLDYIRENIMQLIRDFQNNDDFSEDWQEIKEKLLKFIY